MKYRRPTLVVIIVIIGLALIVVSVFFWDPHGSPSFKELDKIWQETLIAGRGLRYSHGKVETSPNDLLLTMDDYRREAWFGVLAGGGWQITGKKVAEVTGNQSKYQLYGRRTIRWHPYFWDNYFYQDEDVWYDFFLMERPLTGGRGRIIKAWKFDAEETVFSIGAALLLPRGYNPPFEDQLIWNGDGTLSVRINGLVEPLEETIIPRL